MKGCIVTEGEWDAALLRTLLEPELAQAIRVVAAGGRSSVVSYATSILVSKREPVALVLDADTVDAAAVRSQERVIYDPVRAAAYRTPFRLFLMVPQLETVLFRDVEVLSHLTGVEVGQQDLREAEVRPKQVLEELLRLSPQVKTREALLTRMDAGTAARIRRDPLLLDLFQFVRRPTVWDPWNRAGAA
jgi:hypothetical protein